MIPTALIGSLILVLCIFRETARDRQLDKETRTVTMTLMACQACFSVCGLMVWWRG